MNQTHYKNLCKNYPDTIKQRYVLKRQALDPTQIQLLKDVDLHLTLSNLLCNGY